MTESASQNIVRTELEWRSFEECAPPYERGIVIHLVDRSGGYYDIAHRFAHGVWKRGANGKPDYFSPFESASASDLQRVHFKHWALPTIPAPAPVQRDWHPSRDVA
jgi:hypothetical protein